MVCATYSIPAVNAEAPPDSWCWVPGEADKFLHPGPGRNQRHIRTCPANLPDVSSFKVAGAVAARSASAMVPDRALLPHLRGCQLPAGAPDRPRAAQRQAPRRGAGPTSSDWVLNGQVARPRWLPTDRLLLAAISRALPRPAWRSLRPAPRRCSAGSGSWSAASGPPTRRRPMNAPLAPYGHRVRVWLEVSC